MNNQGELVDLPAALFQLTTVVFIGVATWAAVVAFLASWRPTARLARALTPRMIRAAIFTTVSGSIALGSPAHAADGVDGLPYPDRTSTSAPADAAAAAPDGNHHRVRSGESLWTIATAALPAGTSPADIADATEKWYEANRTTIGADPNLIHPGQDLVAPHSDDAR